MFGPFKISIPKHAIKIDINVMLEHEKEIITKGINFDPNTHDAYSFSIVPQIIEKENFSRKKKKKSYKNVNSVFVSINPGCIDNDEIRFVGIYPTTLSSDGNWSLDMEAKAEVKPIDVGITKLVLTGIGKYLFRSKKQPIILAYRHTYLVQWVFSKKWISEGNPFDFKILCIVKKGLDSNKYIFCSAQFSQSGRKIKRVKDKKILLAS